MPKRGTKGAGNQQEVTGQVTGRAVGHCDSVDNARSLSPVSASSCISVDFKDIDMYKLRVSELERELVIARKQAELAKQEHPVHDKSEPQANIKTSDLSYVHPNSDTTLKQRPSLPSNNDLPRVELTPFDGQPERYCQFIRQYENFIESKVTDPGQRFLYLMHYCRGRAKEAIEGCAMLDPEAGYTRARQILREMFGQPHKVARHMIDGVLFEARRTRGDARSLSNLVIKMQNCSIALNHLAYRSDLDALQTLESIVRCLPVELQSYWAIEADRIGKLNREATFDELTDFINTHSRIANSRFGQLVREGSRTSRGTTNTGHGGSSNSQRPAPWANTYTISQDAPRQTRCKLCPGSHLLVDCDVFLKMNVSDRWTAAKRTGSCFTCLADSHRAAMCRSNTKCSHDGCNGSHHRLLHRAMNKEQHDPPTNPLICNVNHQAEKNVRLGVVSIGVVTPKGITKAVAFLDNGSDTTLVTRDFVNRCELPGDSTSLTISTVGGSHTTNSKKCSLQLQSLVDEESVDVPLAYVVDSLPIKPIGRIETLAKQWPHLNDLPFQEMPGAKVDILIGCDIPEAHWALDQRLGKRKEPFAVRTIFGWTLFGPMANGSERSISINCIQAEESEIRADLKRLYDGEFQDISNERTSPSVEDLLALRAIESGTKHVNGRFTIPIPWRPDSACLPYNREIAIRRLHYLRKRLLQDPGLRVKYVQAMQRNIKLGYVESAGPINDTTNPVWYLPHHPVINPKKPDKVRVVFDCAAKYHGVSLNDCIMQGPDWTTPLVEVLCRFRLGKIAVSADITEMFMQVKMPEETRNAFRLLWWPDGDMDQHATEYRMTVHPFGAISSPFCANFALKETFKRHAHIVSSSMGENLGDSFYVDDFLGSFDDAKTAIRCAQELVTILEKGGFHLTKWISNCREVLQSVPEAERAGSLRELGKQPLPVERTLGVQWDAETDEFLFQLNMPLRSTTRRGILSAVASLYDPLGLVSPWLLPGKILLQRLCRKKIEWDATLEEEDHRDWNDWLKVLSQLGGIRIARRVSCTRELHNAYLHLFSDASESGYGVVAYGSWIERGSHRRSSLLFAKARVAPLKTVSIPRLELSAATLAVKVAEQLKRCFTGITLETVYWTDSAIVLHYINNVTTRFNTFVANRLTLIHERTTTDQWRYVQSANNPADYCSRGLKSLDKLNFWTNGPEFISIESAAWPVFNAPQVNEEDVEKKRLVLNTNLFATDNLLRRLEKFSSWTKILRAIVWWTRFKRQLTIMTGLRPKDTLNVGPILPVELATAENDVIRMLQLQTFPSEMRLLSNCLNDMNKGDMQRSTLRKLCPVLVDGLMRVGGRLTHAQLDFDVKHPMILPNNHHITQSLIKHIHIQEGHAGESHLLNFIRRRFWIINGRAAVRRVIRPCIFCRRQNALVGKQLMSSLPAIRVQKGWWPFADTGLDYFGPLLVKRKTSTEKRYGCLMTCLQSRAVHLEMVHNMSTDSFLMAWQRFVGRRGVPSNVLSDNGSNFVGAQKELTSWLKRVDKSSIQNQTSSQGTCWQFNPPYASHRGGVWERLIRSARRILIALCNQQTPNDETLTTLLVEVERIMNNRPIVPVSSDECQGLALTPNDLLLRRSNDGLPMPKTISSYYSSGWKHANYLAGVFWKRWTREYLPTLQARQKWIVQRRSFKEGDVVLLAEEKSCRNDWPIGIVTECITDPDALVRTVKVKTSTGEHLRDIRKICLLEGDDKAVAQKQ